MVQTPSRKWFRKKPSHFGDVEICSKKLTSCASYQDAGQARHKKADRNRYAASVSGNRVLPTMLTGITLRSRGLVEP